MSKIDTGDVEEGNETEIAEERIRKWTTERAIRMMGPKEEEIKEEGKAKIESEGSSEMQDTQMSGVTCEEAKTGLTTEGSGGEEGSSSKKREGGATTDADRKLGFAPYAEFTNEEVLSRKAGYVKFLVEAEE